MPKSPLFARYDVNAERTPEGRALCRLLQDDRAVFYALRMWAGCIEDNRQGVAPDAETLADLCGYRGPLSAAEFKAAMVQAGYIDADDNVAGWWERYGKAMSKREREAERSRRNRAQQRMTKQALQGDARRLRRTAIARKLARTVARKSQCLDEHDLRILQADLPYKPFASVRSTYRVLSLSYAALQAAADDACAAAPSGAGEGVVLQAGTSIHLPQQQHPPQAATHLPTPSVESTEHHPQYLTPASPPAVVMHLDLQRTLDAGAQRGMQRASPLERRSVRELGVIEPHELSYAVGQAIERGRPTWAYVAGVIRGQRAALLRTPMRAPCRPAQGGMGMQDRNTADSLAMARAWRKAQGGAS